MSYSISIFAGPLPADDAVVWGNFESILINHQKSVSDQKRHPALCALIDVLLTRFPDLTSFGKSDPASAESPWSAGPLINDVSSEMARLGIVNSRIGDVMPFLITEALRLGLTVADEFSGQVFRPGSVPASSTYLTLDLFDSWEYPRDSEFCQWFAKRYPEGVEMADLFAVMRADSARLFDPLEPLLERVISKLDTKSQLEQLRKVIEVDVKASVSKSSGASGVVSEGACRSESDEVFTATYGVQESAVTMGKWSPAVTFGNFAYASSSGSASSAVVCGSNSCAMTSGVAAMAVATNRGSYSVATNNYASGISCNAGSRAFSSGEAGSAVALGGWSHATSTGSRAHALATGERSQAFATGFLGSAVSLGYGSGATVSDEAVIAASLGPRGMARAGVGGAIVLGYYENDSNLVHVRASRVGDNGIRPDVWYRLDSLGEFKMVEN